MPWSGSGAIVRLTSAGVGRVLNGQAGMTFEVDAFSQYPGKGDQPAGQQMVHVKDYRFPDEALGRKFQVWSLGEGHYEMVIPPREGSGCECCDHRLQHIIRRALNEWVNGFPVVSMSAIMTSLRESLEDWEADRG